jgi:hypothetical protein
VQFPTPVTEDLRVPKRQVPVEVVLPGGHSRQVALFVAEAAAGHEGPERVSDLLNGREPFIPALDRDAGSMTFLQRTSIAVARTSAEAEPEAAGFTIPMEHDVEITLSDGTRLTGTVTFVAPPQHERLIDFLNRPEPFFRLLEREGVALVGRAHVARVALVSR